MRAGDWIMSKVWDYIIVGAGSAGCVMAERLSADGRSQVLVLEAGGENDSFWVTLPKGVAKLVKKPEHMGPTRFPSRASPEPMAAAERYGSGERGLAARPLSTA
jgi:choline dehydrogenase-like flavoprotein